MGDVKVTGSFVCDFSPSLFDKLFDDTPNMVSETNGLRRLNIDKLKDSVAKDIEALLNNRRGLTEIQLQAFKYSANSILSFGIIDFVGLSLSNPTDCNRICRSIEQAIARHDSRLKNIQVGLENDRYSTNTLRFNIRALLIVHPLVESVNFDAFLQSSSQQYTITPSRNLGIV